MSINNSISITLGNLNIEIFDLYKTYVTYELTPIAHQHTFYEIHFILDGWVSLNINDQTYKIEKDSFFVYQKTVHIFALNKVKILRTLLLCLN